MAGLISLFIASPVDVIKVRLMSDPDAYRGIFDCLSRVLCEEGVPAFYKGFVPNFVRFGTWSMIMFSTRERVHDFIKLVQNW